VAGKGRKEFLPCAAGSRAAQRSDQLRKETGTNLCSWEQVRGHFDCSGVAGAKAVKEMVEGVHPAKERCILFIVTGKTRRPNLWRAVGMT
jgi:hypothetical protein